MAKKKTNKSASNETKLIKLTVTPEEQDMIRLAAALRRLPMAVFARELVLEEARRLTEGIEIPK